MKIEASRQEIIGSVDDAIDRFWESVTESFPEIKSGILFKNTQSYHHFHITCQNVIQKWVDGEGWTK
jgi:hypothetical protein